jgi:hypothetical protein
MTARSTYDIEGGLSPSAKLSLVSYRDDFDGTDKGKRTRKVRFWFYNAALFFFLLGAILLLLGPFVFHWPREVTLASITSSSIISIILFVVGWRVYEYAYKNFRPQALLDATERERQEQEQLARDTGLPALLKYNREQMALYHKIATNQARTAGRNSQIFMSIGFLALVVGAIVAINASDQTTKLLVGALASLGSLFSAYITKTFFTAQKAAIDQLYKYWEQPLAASYFLAAERIADTISEDGKTAKDQQLAMLIDQVLQAAMRREAEKLAMSSSSAAGSRRTSRRNSVARRKEAASTADLSPAQNNKASSASGSTIS